MSLRAVPWKFRDQNPSSPVGEEGWGVLFIRKRVAKHEMMPKLGCGGQSEGSRGAFFLWFEVL